MKTVLCFYFEAFDEPWKRGAGKTHGIWEKHFGLFTVDGKAKVFLVEFS
ncbi:MAG: hypothetical protein CM15mP83_2680 [Flavobacteriaceae bacterium]|nr:MAG: hypothetical protein CM15mP83_2680 [Flavobacteriaceae bacterium]